jgi:hypothetical protein
MSFNLNTDSIVKTNNDGPVNILHGISIPPDIQIDIIGEMSVSGIASVEIVNSSSVNVSGIVTATSFVGDGSGLTGLTTITRGQSIGFKFIFSDPPLRS